MYDVTSEQSFKNLRNWITSMKVLENLIDYILIFKLKIRFKIKESASDDCLLSIIGNKIDLCDTEEDRVVKYKDGANLADVWNIFKILNI